MGNHQSTPSLCSVCSHQLVWVLKNLSHTKPIHLYMSVAMGTTLACIKVYSLLAASLDKYSHEVLCL